ncbi:hypothetical protein LO749_20885 [Paracoccus denitrificans]|uniref:deoxynucleotide monophosphate kinase family protein n=1 Tax=Paracoccus denitrificans TaxID=266 RepID=UPI001E4BDA4F|nr:hypothetical protein [Paracoccus denitrificans]UFS66951.1 hypothetical protein LO749_20885 [Paracoccus denitrificans]
MVPKLIGLYSAAPQSGKSTVADILWQRHGFWIESFAAPLKGMVEELLIRLGMDTIEIDDIAENRKEEVIPALGKSYREICQTLGTEWGRDRVHPDIWVRAGLGRLSGRAAVVFDDVRFPNEAEAILARGGQVWKITRPGAAVTHRHVSEGGLEDWNFHRVITNDGTLADLSGRVEEALHDPH